ncbi:MAG: hypothetical protein ACI8PZ_001620 [Myxococcota bacterium]|jgi:hypothetical protein
MSREVTEAHYLHERHGLEAVLRPPVDQPSALAWIPGREELLIATRVGDLMSVDPVLGTRQVMSDLGEIATIAIAKDRSKFLAISRQGRWYVGTLRGELLEEGRHDFLAGIGGFFAGKYIVLTGDTGDGKRFMRVIEGSTDKSNVRLPKRVIATLDASGRPLLARSTPSGLVIVPFGKNAKFPNHPSTVHRLKPTGQHILGFTTSGVCVWDHSGGSPESTRLPDLTAGDLSRDSRYLGLGTRTGAVALSRMDRKDKRMRPDLVRAYNTPVTAVSFSTRGRWLATAAEAVRLWTWEDDD